MNVLEYKEIGVLPEALLNYVVRLGWSYGDQELFQLEELIKIFKDGKLNNSPASFSHDKLIWFNREYFLKIGNKSLLQKVASISSKFKEDEYSLRVINLIKERCSLLSEFDTEGAYFFDDKIIIDSEDAKKIFTKEALEILKFLIQSFEEMKTWDIEGISKIINKVKENKGVGMASVGKPFRFAITGRMNSASVDETSLVLGKEKVLKRLEEVIKNYP